MYKAIANSPSTQLATAISDTDKTIELVDGSVLPDAPNLAVIGIGETAETILYVEKNGNILNNVSRGFQGTAQAWSTGVKVARNFTAYDHDAFKENIETLNQQAGDIENLTTVEKSNLVDAINELLTKIGETGSLTTDEKSNLVAAVNEIKQKFTAHLADNEKHIAPTERTSWNNKQNALGYSPLNKAGDTMSGNLGIDNAGPGIVLNYNGVIKGNFYYLAGDDCLYLFNRDGASTYRGGFRFKPDKNVDIYDGTTYRKIWHAGNAGPFYVGLGSPEGVVTASVGAIYQRTDGAASTTLYVKESGTGNVGWKAK